MINQEIALNYNKLKNYKVILQKALQLTNINKNVSLSKN
jgi:hypothetical protein